MKRRKKMLENLFIHMIKQLRKKKNTLLMRKWLWKLSWPPLAGNKTNVEAQTLSSNLTQPHQASQIWPELSPSFYKSVLNEYIQDCARQELKILFFLILKLSFGMIIKLGRLKHPITLQLVPWKTESWLILLFEFLFCM